MQAFRPGYLGALWELRPNPLCDSMYWLKHSLKLTLLSLCSLVQSLLRSSTKDGRPFSRGGPPNSRGGVTATGPEAGEVAAATTRITTIREVEAKAAGATTLGEEEASTSQRDNRVTRGPSLDQHDLLPSWQTPCQIEQVGHCQSFRRPLPVGSRPCLGPDTPSPFLGVRFWHLHCRTVPPLSLLHPSLVPR